MDVAEAEWWTENSLVNTKRLEEAQAVLETLKGKLAALGEQEATDMALRELNAPIPGCTAAAETPEAAGAGKGEEAADEGQAAAVEGVKLRLKDVQYGGAGGGGVGDMPVTAFATLTTRFPRLRHLVLRISSAAEEEDRDKWVAAIVATDLPGRLHTRSIRCPRTLRIL